MNTHEYQAKEVLQKQGIPVPPFAVAETVEEVKAALDRLHLDQAVIKAQVHAGGRGKAGGVKIAKGRDEILDKAGQMLGMKLITKQTGPSGIIVRKVLICAPVDIEKEYYVSAVIDRQKAQATLIVSPEGGVDIEEVAEKSPEKILKVPFRFDGHLHTYQKWRVVKFMGWTGDVAEQGMKLLEALAKTFIETDASMLEINPLVLTPEGKLLAIDAKLAIDENALYRHPTLAAYDDPTQLPMQEARAKEFDLAYIAMEGNIGCMVNGAGLAMATMDIIQHYGGKPANFLDVGGGASKEKVAEGFKIIVSDPHVKAILVNIFGGIMNCVTLAGGIIAAMGELELNVPLIVRLEGTNADKGKRMLEESGLNIITAQSLDEAAKKAVGAVNGSTR